MTKIEKLFVIVCEEDYKYSLYDWDKHTTTKQVEIVNDARDSDQSFIFNQEWIIEDGDYSLYQNLNELMGRECKIMTTVLVGVF